MEKDKVKELLSGFNIIIMATTFLLFIVLASVLAFCDIWNVISQDNIDFFAKIINTDLLIFCICFIIFAIEMSQS
jgi:hypothetical protein